MLKFIERMLQLVHEHFQAWRVYTFLRSDRCHKTPENLDWSSNRCLYIVLSRLSGNRGMIIRLQPHSPISLTLSDSNILPLFDCLSYGLVSDK